MYAAPRGRCQSAGLTEAEWTFTSTSSSLLGLSTSVKSRTSGGLYFVYATASTSLLQNWFGAASRVSRNLGLEILRVAGPVLFGKWTPDRVRYESAVRRSMEGFL